MATEGPQEEKERPVAASADQWERSVLPPNDAQLHMEPGSQGLRGGPLKELVGQFTATYWDPAAAAVIDAEMQAHLRECYEKSEVFTLTLTTPMRHWRFPETRFVEFDQADELHALRLGWSPWGGEECEELEEVTYPACLVLSMDETGVTFEVVQDISEVK